MVNWRNRIGQSMAAILATNLMKFARWIAYGFICATAFTVPTFALNPTYKISQYAHTSWKSDAGIQAVRRIKQTPDGYLWLATRTGLIRFDGVRFTTFKAGSVDGLESSTMQDLVIDPDGSIWVATIGGGVSQYKTGRFHTYTTKDGLPSDEIGSLYRDSHGTLWVGTRGAGVARMVGDHFESLSLGIPPSRINAIQEDTDHSLWFATNGDGVFRLRNGILTSFTVKDGLPDDRVDALYRDHAGKIWTAGWKGISFWDGARFVIHPAVNAAVGESQAVSCIEDRDGDLWIASQSGLFRAHGEEVSRMDRSTGLSGDYVSDVYEDKEGNIWAGTRSGLDRFRDQRVRLFSQPVSPVRPVLADNRGVWTMSNRQITRIAANAIRAWHLSLPAGSTPLTLSSGPDDCLLIGSDKGVWIWSGQHIRSVPELSGLKVRSLLRAHDGSIWVGTSNRGLLHWVPSSGSRSLTETGVADRFISSLAEDHNGAIWASSIEGGGLYRLSGGHVEHFGRDEGLRSLGIYTVFVDGNGDLWIGSAGGLSWFQDGRIRTVNSQQGLPADQVFAILDDSYGWLWFTGFAGISAIDKKSLTDWAAGRRHNLDPVLFQSAEALQMYSNVVNFPNCVRTPDGHLWFSLADGLAEVIPPDPTVSHTPQFPVMVEDVTVDGVPHTELGPIRIQPGARSIEMRYTALTLSNAQAVRFQYRLEGVDNDWVNADTRRLAFYNNLKPGEYTFHVAATLGGAKWLESPAVVMEQLPFIYQTLWFQLLASATALALVFFIYRLRLRQAVDRIQAGFQQRIDERTRIARDLHDTLLQSFQGAVFQFQAARKLLLRNADNAMQVVDEAIQAAEEGIKEGRAAIRDLRPEPVAQRTLPELLKSTGHELAATHQWNGNAPTFSVIVEGKQRDLSIILQDEVYRISREVIRNAFAHADARHIEVEIHYDQDQLRVRIRDDGKGIDQKILKAGALPGHWGIPGMRERAQRIGSQLDFWSEMGAGTEVQLKVPAAIAYQRQGDSHRFRLFHKANGDGRQS